MICYISELNGNTTGSNSGSSSRIIIIMTMLLNNCLMFYFPKVIFQQEPHIIIFPNISGWLVCYCSHWSRYIVATGGVQSGNQGAAIEEPEAPEEAPDYLRQCHWGWTTLQPGDKVWEGCTRRICTAGGWKDTTKKCCTSVLEQSRKDSSGFCWKALLRRLQ